jgi:threonine synthase
MPSGSFKDRGTSVAISRALDLGVDHVIEDSSGNAGISLSIYAAKAGVKADIYVPKDIPKGKLKILEAAEANIFLSNNRKKAYENAVKASKNGFYIGHLWNPFYIEGFKTLVYEVWEQLGGLFPDHIFVPVGSGSNLLGIYYGLEDLLDVGYIDEIPSLIAVEAAGYDIIHKELFGDSGLPRTELADGLRVLFKPRKRELLEIIRTYGHAMVVDETEIMEAYKSLWRLGFTVEPTSSVVYAAFKKAYESGDIRGDDIVLLPLTGNGIKMII